MIELVKLHGLGNDFLVLLGDGGELAGPASARQLCERRTGIGADGLVRCRRDPGGGAGLSFELWNADGSQAEMSGNGLRCMAHAALDAGWVESGRPFTVSTAAGPRSVSVERRSSVEVWAVVDMGTVEVLDGDGGTCNVGDGRALVDVGNPHLVVLGPDPAGVDVATLGPRLEATAPAGLNVEFVALGPGPDSITMRVWERGVGETRACGTGSCAAAAALHRWGRVGRAVTVHQPGGAVAVVLGPDGTATLAGPSVRVATCSVETPVSCA
jgi:diaminopimelate epimerase